MRYGSDMWSCSRSKSRFVFVIVGVCFLSLCFPCAWALQRTVELEWPSSWPSRFYPLFPWTFGLDSGSTVSGHLQLRTSASFPGIGSAFAVVLLRYKEWLKLKENQLYSSEASCLFPSSLRFSMTPSVIEFSATVPESNEYALFFLNCADLQVSVTGLVSFRTSSGSYLSTDKIPYLELYRVFGLLYIFLSFVWIIYYLRSRQNLMKIHQVLTLSLYLKLFEMISSYSSLLSASTTGNDEGFASVSSVLLVVFSNSIFLAFLLLTSLGWTIIREGLSPREEQLFGASIVLFIVFEFLKSFCKEPSVCPAYLLSFQVVRFLVTFGVLVIMNTNIERLRSMISIENWVELRLELAARCRLFVIFRWIFILYLMFPVLIIFFRYSLLESDDEYLLEGIHEIIAISAYLVVIFYFPPRPSFLREAPTMDPAPLPLMPQSMENHERFELEAGHEPWNEPSPFRYSDHPFNPNVFPEEDREQFDVRHFDVSSSSIRRQELRQRVANLMDSSSIPEESLQDQHGVYDMSDPPPSPPIYAPSSSFHDDYSDREGLLSSPHDDEYGYHER